MTFTELCDKLLERLDAARELNDNEWSSVGALDNEFWRMECDIKLALSLRDSDKWTAQKALAVMRVV